jgi:CubicO group peptidase (beta-lactamase class C family)
MATQTPAIDEMQALRDTVTAAMEEHRTPGVAVGILHDGEEHVAGFGVSSILAPVPVDGDMLFQIGSTSKTITALIAMRLVEQGSLDLDTPVRTYLPEFRMADADVTERLTMRHLFQHTGGFDGDYFADFGRGDEALDRCVQSMVNLTQLAPLGAVWSYCNSGFYLAGRVIEAITGKTYEAAARELAIDPLGMKHSFYSPEETMTYKFAVGHAITDDGVNVARPWPIPRIANAAGGLASSARDNLRYARFMMGDGTAEDGTRLLAPESMEKLIAPDFPAGPGTKVGLAWYNREVGGVRIVSHGGGTNGQVSAFLFAPERNFALAVLTNGNKGEVLQAVTKWALERYLGASEPKPERRAATERELSEYVSKYESITANSEITRAEDTLIFSMAYKPDVMAKISDQAPPQIPPMALAMVAEDRAAVTEGPYKEMEIEFVRDSAGQVGWIRVGGRLHTRKR